MYLARCTSAAKPTYYSVVLSNFSGGRGGWKGEKPLCSWGVWGEVGGQGCCKPSPMGSRDKALKNIWLFCILNSSKHRSHGSVTMNGDKSFTLNFYIFEKLGVWVWDPKLVYQLQNSSGYSTVFKSQCCRGRLTVFPKIITSLSAWKK